VTVTAGSASQLGITTQPVAGASGASLTTAPVLAIKDAQGNTVTTDNSNQVTVAIQSGNGGTLGGTTTVTAVNGVASFSNLSLSGTTGTNYVLRFTSGSLTAADATAVTVTAGSASQLGITAQPVAGASGASLTTAPVLAIKDAQGNLVTTDNSSQVTVAIQSGNGGTLGGTTTVTAVNGIASFSNLTLSGTTGTNYVLRFTSGSLTAADANTVTVTAGSASQLGITTQPVAGASGASLTTAPVLAIKDAQGNTVTTDNNSQVTVAIQSGNGGTLGGTTTVTAVNGIASFSNLSLSGTTGTNYVLRFTSGTLTAADSGNVNVSAGTATTLSVSGPATTTAGSVLNTLTVTAQDAQGNTATGYTGTVHFSSTDSAGVLPTDYTFVGGDQGSKTFSVTLNTSGINTVTATDTVTSSITGSTGNITVSAGAASRLAFTTQPGGGSSGSFWTIQPVVEIQDAQGNRVTGASDTVTLTITPGTGTAGAALTCTNNPMTAVNGIATFAGCQIDKAGTGYTLAASSGVLTAATSSSFITVAGTGNRLSVTTQPVAVTSGGLLNTQPVVSIQDAQGNTVTTDNSSQITVAIQSGNGGTLGGTTTVTVVNGVASFSNLTLSGTTGTNYVLRFTSGSLTAADATAVTVTAGSASQLGITTQPVAGASGASLITAPVLAIKDAQGNTVTTDNSSQVTVAIQSGNGGTLGGTTTVTAVNGVASFSNLTLSGTTGTNYVLRFTSGSLTAADSGNLSVTAGVASHLSVVSQPVGGVSGFILAGQPVIAIQDAQNNNVIGSTAAVTVALATGNGTLGGNMTVNAVNGVATFSGLTLSGTAGQPYALRFSVNGLASIESAPLTVSATVPGAPINVIANAGNRQVSLSWTAPIESGGLPITGYTATGTPGGSCTTTGSTQCAVTGLTNGVNYTFTVVARNAQGESLPSSISASVTPLSTTAPYLSSVSPNSGPQGGGTSVSLSGTDLAGATSVLFGGTAAQSFQINGENLITAISPAHLGGDVDIEVTTPAGTARLHHGYIYEAAPAMPGAPIVAAGNQQATVSWAQVLSGGDPSGYTVTATPGGQTCHASFPGRAFPYASCIVSGLTNGVAYTFTVTAENSLGRVTSPSSDPATPQGLANGRCGAAEGVPTLVQPMGLLCASGDAGPVTHDSGKFVWSCLGQNGGTTQQCDAPGQSSAVDQQTPSAVTLENTQSAGGCAVQEATLSTPPNQGPGQGVNMPYGAVQFEMVNCQDAEVLVRLTYANIVEGMQYWKYVINSYHNGWVQMPADQVTLRGNTVEFTVVDNGEWDNNPAVGVVSDPGGPAYDPTLFTSPGQPTDVSVTAGDRSATVTWTAPDSGGQPAVYRVEALINGAPSGQYCEVNYPSTQCTVQGLINGQSYTFKVTAINGAGVSAPVVEPMQVVPQPLSPPPPKPIPVMDEAGLFILASLIGLLAVLQQYPRRRGPQSR